MKIPSLESVKQELARRNYYEYVKYTHRGQYQDIRHGQYIADMLQQAIENRQQMIAGELESKKQLYIFSIPPRHSKSMTITETYPSYFLGKFPHDRVILTSYGDDLAKRFSKKNIQKVNEYGMALFDIGLDSSTRSTTDWDIAGTRGGCISRGIMAGVTGQGADLLIIDDPIKTREEANSEVYREKVWLEWVDSLSTRLHPMAIVIVIMTRWHEDDLVGRLLNSEYAEVMDWTVVNLPLEAEEGDLLGREINEPLWPERYGYEFIEERKKYPQSFNALFQGRPTSQEGNILKRGWWRYYDVLPRIQKKILSIDASFKDTQTSDFVSIQVWGKTEADIYMIDNLTARMDFVTTIQAIQNVLNKHKDIGAKFVEDKANGSAIISVLNRKLGGFIPVKVDAGTGGKIARVESVTPWIEAGNVYLPRQSEWTHDFVEECASFPNAKHDDQVDAMSQGLSKLIYFAAEIPQPNKRDEFLYRDNQDTYELDQSYINMDIRR